VLDCSDSEAIGDIACGNQIGSLAAAHGPMSVFVLGASFVLRSGERITVGSRARKDVTGYDILRYALSCGDARAALASLTCKVVAAPPHWAHTVVSCADLGEAIEHARLIDDRVHPIGLLCADDDGSDAARIYVRLAGARTAVEEQRRVVEEMNQNVASGDDHEQLASQCWARFDDRGCRHRGGSRGVVPTEALAALGTPRPEGLRRIVNLHDGRVAWFAPTPATSQSFARTLERLGGRILDTSTTTVPPALRQRLDAVFSEAS
jgi:FAD/FMN-containing dehydrogenase